MPITLAFDVYGTLIDTHGVDDLLGDMIGEGARAFSLTWRAKQLEYSFRRGLMQAYEPFPVCTSQALDFACSYHQVSLSAPQRQQLVDRYRKLPAFADVAQALDDLKQRGFALHAFSNGTRDAVEALLSGAGISHFFEGIVSADDIRTFKPAPAVYRHFLHESGAAAADTWLVSSNPFDVLGALSAGWRAAWIQRSEEAVFDPWGEQPTLVASSVAGLASQLDGARSVR